MLSLYLLYSCIYKNFWKTLWYISSHCQKFNGFPTELLNMTFYSPTLQTTSHWCRTIASISTTDCMHMCFLNTHLLKRLDAFLGLLIICLSWSDCIFWFSKCRLKILLSYFLTEMLQDQSLVGLHISEQWKWWMKMLKVPWNQDSVLLLMVKVFSKGNLFFLNAEKY